MNLLLKSAATLLFFVVVVAGPVSAQTPTKVRVADVTTVDGVEDNYLAGVGLVVGLDGTGDGDGLAKRMAANILKRRDINVLPDELSATNIAVVEVQAVLPPFKRPGDRVDVYVSSMGGKAKSLFGGRLVAVQLTGPDPNTVYAIAQGPVVSGVEASGASGSREKVNHPTAGRITDGAIVVREVPQRLLARDGVLRLKLRNASYATAKNLAVAVNELLPDAARAVDGQTVEIRTPPTRRNDPVGLLDEIGRIPFEVDPPARVVIDAATGTITVGGKVALITGAIAHGSISVSIQETPQVSQPNSFGRGETTTTPNSTVRIDQRGTELHPVPAATSAADVARALNALGLGPRDLVAVFQSLKANGLLAAELVIQ
jgi:flagellar P-ring protein FlgI